MPLPDRPSLEFLRKLAKDRLQEMRRTDPAARLADDQREVAREHDAPSWRALRAEVAKLFDARGLPTTFGGAAVEDVLAYLARDKKRRGNGVPFVLVESPGVVTPGHDVAADQLRSAVEEVAE